MMKKSKLLSRLLRGGSGGSTKGPSGSGPPELGEAGVAPNPVVAARSSSGRRRETVSVSAPTSTTTARDPSLFHQQTGQAPPRAGVERSSSWKYTHDHTPDSFSINSSPSILDGRSGTGSHRGADEGQTIEKSQSWSGDRLLDCATDSGSSRGGTNNSSRAGSGSRAGSRTGTSSRSSRERGVIGGPPSLPASSRAGSRAGSATASRAGSDRGDSTPSSVYDHPVDHSRMVSQTDADGYENVELPSPQRDSGDSSSDQGSSHQHGSRLSVKSSGRRSRRPSPRRQGILSKSQQESTESRGTRGSVRGNVPSISLSTSSPVPPPKASVSRSPSRKSRRSPSRSPNRPPSRSPSRSDSRKRDSQRNSSRSPSRAPSRSPSRGPSGSPVRALSRSPSRLSSRAPGMDPWTRMPGTQDPAQMHINGEAPFPGGPRSMSYEEGRMGARSPQPPPLWKARSWQQYSITNSTPQSERARQLAKSRSWQQSHVANIGQGQSVDIVLNRSRQHHITRQEAVQPTPSAAMGKSRSWQQSHEADPLPGPLPRTYTVSEKRGRRSSVRLAPPSPTRPSPPSYSHSPARSPLAALPPQPHPSSTTHAPIHDSRHIHHPPMRSQASIGGYGAPPSASHTPHLTDYVELRNYEAMERQQQQQQEYVDLRQYRAEQVRPQRDPHWRERFYPPTAFSHLKQLQQQQLQQQLQHQQFQQQLQQQAIRLKQQRQLQHQKSLMQPGGYDSQYGSPQRMDGEYASLQEVRDGMVRSDSVRDAIIQNGAMREGVMRNGSIRNASVRNGSVRNGVVRDGSVRDGFVREGSVHREGSMRGDSTVRYRPPPLSKPTSQSQTTSSYHGKPVKSSSLMTSQELLNTLKRQLALSSPTHTSRSKSLEAGRAAMAAMGTEGEREEEGKRAVVGEEGGEAGRLSPALMALVAEKRARLKRSTGAFTGSGGGRVPVLRQFTAPPARCSLAGLTSDSECDDKKSSASSTGGGDRPFPSASPQPPGAVVSTHDYNMEQSNVALLKAELKIVTTDRDIMKKELKKVSRERDEAIKGLTGHHSDQPANYGTLTKHGGVSASDKSLSMSRDYESLKMQCEKAMAEVQGLLKQNVDITRKYENTLKEVDYYKKQERAAYTALQNLRMQYEEVVAEKQKLEREVTSLQTIMEDDRKEIADLRRQQQEAMSQEGSGEAINQLYMTTMRKYEAIKDEYDSIRKRYSDLVASHSNNISKLELTQEEVSRLKKQYDEILRECNEAVREKNCLKQQCTKAITEWDSALREKNKLQEDLLKIREKYDEMMKEMNTHLMQRQHLNKDLKRLQEERNAAMQEYTLVMSERDTVHKEMDKLQEELTQASKKIKTIEQTTNDSSKERESLLLQIEMLKREIAASLHDRDKAIKECNDLRERFGAKEDTNKEWERSYKDYDYKQEREMTLKEGPNLGSSSHDMFSKAQKERLDNLDQANQEIDRLRKTIEKLQNELQEAQQEAEVSKRRRDWAFNERDKIVQERESIRAHCDKLRRERDRAVSELAEALRDSDDMKKQRNEASKELKELKERLEAEQEKAAVVRQLAAHNHSRDSAIDTDMQEWEMETLHMPFAVASERDVGFTVAGGRDDPHYGGSDGAIYVTSITKDGPFEGKLRLHDQIVRLNGLECQGVERASVYRAVVGGGGWIHMTVRRRRSGGRLATAHLHCPHTAHHGLTLHTGVYIANILPGSPAAREGNLAVGDRVLNINGKPVDNIGSCEAAQCLLDTAGEVVQLTTLKSHGSSSLSAPLSSSSSGHNITEDDKSTSSSRPYSSPTSPSKDSGVCSGRSGSRELAKKLVGSGGGHHNEEGTGGKRYGSSEKVVYNVNKATGENRSRPLDLFMNMVRPRRHSKERGECHSESRDKEDKKKLDHEAERAIAQLDSVNNSYHHKSGSNGGTSTTKRSKKREKDKSGGTWPKYRGGGISTWDANSGTIVYTQRRRERPPLSVFLPAPNPLPYTHEEKSYDPYRHEKHLGSRSSSSPRSTPTSPRNQQFPLYKSLDGGAKSSSYSSTGQVYSSQQSSSSMYPSQEVYSSGGPRNPSLDRKNEDSERERGDRLSSLTPSDTSLDFSVRSGNVGKEELEYYSKKNILKYTQSDSESNMSPVDPNPPQSLSLPPVYGIRPPLHHGGDRTPTHSRIPHPHAGLYSPPNPVLRSPPSFTPYSPVSHISLTHTHTYPYSTVGSSSLAVSPRYSSPPTVSQSHFLHSSRSGDSILSSPGLERDLRERGYYENRQASSPTPAGMMGTIGSGVFYHSPSPSLEVPGHHKPRTLHLHPYRPPSDEPPPLPIHSGPPSYHDYQRSMGTMPRKKENERIRIPSNTSVASKSSGGKGGSIERSSERGSPISPSYGSDMISGGSGTGRGPQHVTQISHSVHSPHYQEYSWQRNRPQPGDVRSIYIEKSSEPLGIQIRCLEMGGVYVSSVTVNSLASQVGLCVGDQLLEVCGINMRSATKQSASTVLSQCGTSVTMLVQYNPDKYHEAEGWEGSSSGSSVGGSRSGTPTPRNSPKPPSHDAPHPVDDDDDDDLPPSTTSTLRGPLDMRDTLEHPHDHSLPPSARSTLTRPEIAHVMNSLKRQETFSRRSESAVGGGGVNSSSGSGGGGGGSVGNASDDARLVYLELNKSHNLGIQMVGGNALGIFVHSVPADSPAAKAGLRPGDHILEYNKVDLRHATAEQAAFELAKPADNVTMLVHYDYQRYEEIQDKPGDSFYIRALFDRLGDVGDSTDLRFRKEDILYVDNTMFNNVQGLWRAWVVDEDGHKRQCGTVPSKDKVEEEMRLQRSVGDLQMDSSRRGSTSARRSFFKRKKHFRSSSRDSKELAVFSDASLNYTEAAPMHDEPSPHSYVRVERLDYLVRRPVVMVGPLWELVCDKLVHDYSHKFTKCVPEISRRSSEEMDDAVQNHIVVDYRRRGSHFEATTVGQVKEICDKNCHGILDISLSSVERLHQHNIYPIVLLLKYRHHKQIREVCDSHHPSAERISQKEAKEMYELSIKMEQEYKHVISAVIPAAVNMPYISTQVKSHVDQEQSKTLWVPSGSL